MPLMERRRLGRTGHESSVAILGGAAYWMSSPEDAKASLELALDAPWLIDQISCLELRERRWQPVAEWHILTRRVRGVRA